MNKMNGHLQHRLREGHVMYIDMRFVQNRHMSVGIVYAISIEKDILPT